MQLTCLKKHIFACRTQEISDQWIARISQAIAYTLSTGGSSKKELDDIYFQQPSPEESLTLDSIKVDEKPEVFEVKSPKIPQKSVNLHDFEIEGEIGHGAFAKVYKVASQFSL